MRSKKTLKETLLLVFCIVALIGILYGLAQLKLYLGIWCGDRWGNIIFWTLCVVGMLSLQYRAVKKERAWQDLIAELRRKMRYRTYRRATNNIHGWFIDENNTREGVHFIDNFCRSYYLTYKNRRPKKKELKQLLSQLYLIEEELYQNKNN